ncbi:hypothetical protein ALC56_12844 [Trachymyrmex septentrionalis]|uniref:Uncharacterized protein n=1 Tax=Trachymyrmex septentrionalis TaxID=34720 RepID=A0A195EXL6_9HYME|nr:hypothetical protein ALC56_12844 [Trachymyrmex septentrionalis]
MATTYLITWGAHTFTVAAIYGCVSGETGNGRPCRRTRRWAMLRSVERRRGTSDENELFGCRLSFAVDEKQIGTSEKEEEPAENRRRRRKGGRDEEPEANVFALSPCYSPAEDLWYIDSTRYC